MSDIGGNIVERLTASVPMLVMRERMNEAAEVIAKLKERDRGFSDVQIRLTHMNGRLSYENMVMRAALEKITPTSAVFDYRNIQIAVERMQFVAREALAATALHRIPRSLLSDVEKKVVDQPAVQESP